MKHKLPGILLLLLVLAGRFGAWAQAVDPTFAPVSMYAPATATVSAAAQQPDGKYVVSGGFVRANGATVSTIIRLNADGTTDQTFASNLSTRSSVTGLFVLSSGHILALSTATLLVNGRSYANLVKLNADGTVASGFSTGTGAAGGIIYSMVVQADGKIILAGTFTGFNGTPVSGMVRLNTDGSLDQAFLAALGTGFVGEIYTLALDANSNVLVGGRFTNFNGSGRRALLRLLPSGALDTTYNPIMNMGAASASSVAIDPVTNQAVVYGLNSELTRLNTDGSEDPSFRVAYLSSYCVNFTVYGNARLLVDASRRVVLARGCISPGQLTSSQYLTRYQADGSVDNTFQTSALVNSTVNALVRQTDGQLLVGGGFNRVGNASTGGLVRISQNGQLDVAFRPVLDAPGIVQKIVRQPDGKLLVGGWFQELNGQAAGNLVRLQADGAPDATFTRPSLDGMVQTMVLQPDGKILLAGTFGNVGGGRSMSLARLLPDGTQDPTFTSPLSSIVSITALAVQPDGAILFGANISLTLNGRTSQLHRLLANGTPDATYGQNTGTGFSGSVNEVVLLPDGRHYVGGFFTRFSGATVEPIVRLQPNGTLDPTFVVPVTTASSRFVNRILPLANGQVVVGGLFNVLGGVARTNLTRLNADGSVDATLNTNLNGATVTSIYQQPNGKIILGITGSVAIGSAVRGPLVRLDADGSLDTTFATDLGQIDGSVQSLLAQSDGKLLIGGGFTQVYGQARMGLARLMAPDVLAVGSAQMAARTEAWPVPAHDVLHVALDGTAAAESVQLLDALGRVVLTQASPTAELTLSVQHLRAGVYVLRVNYASGPITRRIVME